MDTRFCVILIAVAAPAVALTQASGAGAITGTVLDREGLPLAGATVTLEARTPLGSAVSDRSGAFRLHPLPPHAEQLRIDAPGYTSRVVRLHRVGPQDLALPPLRLSRASYVRVRFVSRDGDLITAPQVAVRSYDIRGRPLAPQRSDRLPVEAGESAVIGPLPRGIALIALDTPPYARTPLPPVIVTGEDPVIEAGTIVVGPGARLHVHLRDRTGAPIGPEQVTLTPNDAFSAMPQMTAVANRDGEAVFDRLTAGVYRLRAGRPAACGDRIPPVERQIAVPDGGTIRQSIVMGAVSLRLRLSSAGVPVAGVPVEVSSPSEPPNVPAWLKGRRRHEPWSLRWQWRCAAVPTDSEGRTILPPVAPGRVEVTVVFPHSWWTRQTAAPAVDTALDLAIPDGAMPLRVIESGSGAPVSPGTVTWTSAGARAEARLSPDGHALLDGVGTGPGRLSVTARGYRPYSAAVSGVPGTPQQVTLIRAGDPGIDASVATAAGRPVPGAVLLLTPADPLDDWQVTATDGSGVAHFRDLLPGRFELSAWTHGESASTAVTVPSDGTAAVKLLLPVWR